MSYQEKRRYRRFIWNFEVTWIGSAKPIKAQTSNLSLGGCFIECSTQSPTNNTVTINVKLPQSGGLLHLDGEVVHRIPGRGFGVKFGFLNKEQVDALLSFLTFSRKEI
jgi:hypothetical protein